MVSRKLAGLPPDSNEVGWVCGIAVNKGIKHLARASTQKEQPVDRPSAREESIAATPTPEEAAIHRRRYHDLVEGMPDKARVVLRAARDRGAHPEGPSPPRSRSPKARWRRASTGRASTCSPPAVRIEAREARAERRKPGKMGLFVPFGLGAWEHVRRAFDETSPPELEDDLLRDIHLEIARRAFAPGSAALGAALGSLVGGAAVFGALHGHPPTAVEPAPTILRVTEAVPAAVVPTASTLPAVVPSSPAPSPAPPATPRRIRSGLDPSEGLLLQRAEMALENKDFDAARAALREHTRRFPPGHARLTEDRDRLHASLDAESRRAGPRRPDTEK